MFRSRLTVLFALSLTLLPMAGAAQESDTTPPTLAAFDFSPTTVDVTASAQDVTFTLHMTDDLSGVGSVYVFGKNPLGANFAAFPTVTGGTVLVLDGVWTGSLHVEQFVPSGTWTIAFLQMRDVTGNSAVLSTSDLAARGFPTTFTVISNQDVTPPAISSVTVSPATVDVSTAPATITLTVAASDDLSGVNLTERTERYRPRAVR